MNHPAREGYVEVPGARLYVRDVGRGTPVVVLHGGPDFNHSYLLPELDDLASAMRLVYYDQRGRGKSAAGVRAEEVDIEGEVADLDAVRRHFGLAAMALLGHSWGALIAMEYAARHPQRVTHLVVMNGAPASHADLAHFRERRRAAEPETLAAMHAIAATAAYAKGDIAAETAYHRLHFGKALARADGLEAILQRLRIHFTPQDIVKARAIEDRLYAQTWERPDYDVAARLRGIDVPTVVIHGASDMIPVDCARHVADAAPGARLLVLEACGHFAYAEQPRAVREALAALLG